MEKKNCTRTFLASGVATLVAELVTTPVCTLKTKYQHVNGNLKWMCVAKSVYSSDGVLGFYRSSPPAIASQILSMSLKYTLYRHFEDVIHHPILRGVITGLLSTLITHPIDVIKIRYQLNNATSTNIKFTQLYQGYSKSAIKSSIGNSIYFPLFDFLNLKLENVAASSIFTAIIATTILHPVDYLKTLRAGGSNESISARPFKGLALNLSRVVPHFLITMSLINLLN